MIIAIVGMPGSGKTTAASFLKEKDCAVIRFGDITEEILRESGLEINEANERMVREEIRKKHGMDAYAKLNKGKIDSLLQQGRVVAIDGLYSWEEYLFMKDNYTNRFVVLHVYASPRTRYDRLKRRSVRPLSEDEAWQRDKAEIEKLNKAGPIAMADYVIINEDDLESLRRNVEDFYERVVRPAITSTQTGC